MSLVQEAVGWALRRLGVATLLTLAILCVPQFVLAFVLTQNIRGLDSSLLIGMAALGLVSAWWLARACAPGRPGSVWALLLALGIGLPAVAVRVGGLAGKLLALGAQLSDTYRALSTPFADPAPYLEQIALSLSALAGDLATLWGRSQSWLMEVAQGRPAFDPVATALVWSYLVWSVAAWSAWAVRRHANVLLGFVPTVAVLALTVLYVGDEPRALLAPLGAGLALMVVIGQAGREARWRAAGMDFWEGMRLDMTISAVPLLIVLLIAASVVPTFSLERLVRWTQQTFVRPVAEERPVVPESLGLQPRPRPVRPPDNLQAPGLPRRHLIGAGPELSRELVMYVNTSDMPPPAAGIPPELYEAGDIPRLYWLGSTYDFYNGRGWSTSGTREEQFLAGQPLITETIAATLSQTHRPVRQSFLLMANPSGVMYAAGVFESADSDYTAAWRSFGDLFSIRAPDVTEYRVDSWAPNMSESRLREAGASYPDWILERYLQLPDTLPERVRTLARDLTATAPTPYDRAQAIESYLRGYSYTLDLPAPPLGRDVADYFLFDLKRGYCDYFATSMVVLARAAGLPARVAVGYATGTYDPRAARYTVVGSDAHSWPQVYFPGYGWIDFEPTSGLPAIDRPADPLEVDLSALPRAAPTEPITAQRIRAEGQRIAALLLIAMVVVMAGAVWVLGDTWRLSRLPPEQAIARLYGRVYRRGRALGVEAGPADTPFEFGAGLDERLRALMDGRAGAEGQADARLEIDRAELRRLVDLYVRARYSPHPQDAGARALAINAWLTVRRNLWLAWLRRLLLRRAQTRRDAKMRGRTGL